MRISTFKRVMILFVGCMTFATIASAQVVMQSGQVNEATRSKLTQSQNPDQQKLDHYANLSNENVAPGFPVYIDTNNPTADAAAYDAAKQRWVNKNGSLYEVLSGSTQPNILRSQDVIGNQSTFHVIMGNIHTGPDAANFTAKLLSLPEVISANVDPVTKMAVVTVNNVLAPNALETLFDIH